MLIKINGEQYDGRDEMTVAQLLEDLDIKSQRVAVELNLDILPKDQYGARRLAKGDELEIVNFVGGGIS
jgi:sulfur carrier protein